MLLFLSTGQSMLPAADWLTWGGDPQRSNWAKSESTISKDNASKLELKWKAQLDTVPKVEVLSVLTAPLVVEGVNTAQGLKDVVFVVGSDSTVFAIDADTGGMIWQRKFANNLKPINDPTYLCPNTENATPVIDKESGIIYLTTSDGKLRGLSVSNGEDRFPPTNFVPPYDRNWSLNLIDGVIYTPVGRGCDNSRSHFAAMDVSDPSHLVARYYTSAGRPAGAWGLGGLVQGPEGLYAQTADGMYDPAGGVLGNTLVALSLKDLRLVDSFTPENWRYLNQKDLDLGSASPVIFPFQKWTLVATSAKESTIFLLDANNLGGQDHHTPLFHQRYANDEAQLWGRGVWGSMSTWEDAQGRRWLAAPIWGPPSKDAPKFQYTYGPADKGSLMAFQLGVDNDKPTLIPVWMSRDMHVPDPPLIANGVVFAMATGENTRQGGYFPPEVRAKPVSHLIFYAFDAETGKELYSSGDMIDGWTHFAGLAISKGRVYFCTSDAKVYAFGLKQ
jgi:PQQ-like domain